MKLRTIENHLFFVKFKVAVTLEDITTFFVDELMLYFFLHLVPETCNYQISLRN